MFRTIRQAASVVGVLATLALGGCGSDSDLAAVSTGPAANTTGCNPIAAEWDCLLPFPSDVFLEADDSLPSGRRLAITEQAGLHDENGVPTDVSGIHTSDGFSIGSQIIALFPGGVDATNLVGATSQLVLSKGFESPTVLMEAATGERVLHLAELDPLPDDDAKRALLIRPLTPLKHSTRYIVAIRALRDHGGDLIAPPDGFRRLRDADVAGHSSLLDASSRYEADVFPALETAGVARAELQLAWDFTTASQEHLTRDMFDIRADVIERVTASEPVIGNVEIDDDDEGRFRQIHATLRVPLYLESSESAAKLNVDASGRVVANGEVDVPFTVLIPKSVRDRAPSDPPARLIQFGHGFFGSRDEIESFPRRFAEERGFVIVAMDWGGMNFTDMVSVVGMLDKNPAEALRFTDSIHQGMANFIALEYAAAGALASLPELQIAGAPAYDPEHVYFYGISQGAILGGTYMALSPTIERAVLGVGGADFSLMMFRARPFAPFLGFIRSSFPDALDQQKFGALIQIPFDRVDPLTYAPFVNATPPPKSPAQRTVLMQIGIGDTEVPNLAAHLHARALGALHMQPSPRDIDELDTVTGPTSATSIVEFDFGISPLPGAEAKAGDENDVHSDLRKLIASKDQVDALFRPDGVIEHTCDGVCDPE